MSATFLLMCLVVAALDLGAETAQSRLWPAIRKGDAKTVRALLSADPRLLEARMASGTSPILFAIYAGHAELVPLFREFGAVPDFWEAAACGDLEALRQRLAAKPELLNHNAPDGFGALGLAIFFGHQEAAQWLLEQGADPNLQATNAAKPAPLHSATARDNVPMVELLLARGANPDLAQGQGFTALHEAAARGNLGIVEVLLKHGASKLVRTEDGRTPGDLAREKGHAAIQGLLRE